MPGSPLRLVQPTDEAVYYPDISVVCITEDGSASSAEGS